MTVAEQILDYRIISFELTKLNEYNSCCWYPVSDYQLSLLTQA